MRTPPFHRRILPWVFACSFLVMAPVVVFYTAGYRYNTKKGKVERNGTVILDSVPRGASISLDGRALTDKTPITLLDMAPGMHSFTIERPGYIPWSKALDVRPELVTFLNTVHLWKQATPNLVTTSSMSLVSLAPTDAYVLTVGEMDGTSVYRVTDGTGLVRMLGKLAPAPEGRLRATWHNDGTAVLLEARNAAWLIDPARSRQLSPLPPATYRFTRTDLVGNEGKALISIRLGDLSLRRTPLGPLSDLGDDVELRAASGTRGLVLVVSGNPDEGVVLPLGGWQIAREERDLTVLRDGSQWMSVRARERPPRSHRATGDMLRPFTNGRSTSYLLVNGSELWLWDPLTEPRLLLRQSEPLVNAAWHYAGADVIYATTKDVFALNLDPRDGYIVTQLASFDEVRDLSVSSQGMIYVAGKKDGVDGIWTVVTE